MNKSNIKLLAKLSLAFAFTLLLSACGASKKAAKNTTVPTNTVTPNNYAALYQQSFVYQTFSGKIKMHFEGKGQSQNFTTNLKMKKSETVWASIIALGVAEVARAQITPEKLQAVERINRSAYDMSFQEGVAKLNAPITFDMLENLLIGNPIIAGLKVQDTKVVGSEVSLKMEKDGYVQTLIYDVATQTLKKQLVESEEKKFKCTIEYSDYTIISGQNFPKTRHIKIEDKSKGENTNLDMDFNSFEVNAPIEFQFSIPKNYKMKSL